MTSSLLVGVAMSSLVMGASLAVSASPSNKARVVALETCEGCAPHIAQLPGNGITYEFINWSVNGDCHTVIIEEEQHCLTEECHTSGSIKFTNNTGGTVYVKQSRSNCTEAATIVNNTNSTEIDCDDDELGCGIYRIIYFSSTAPGTNCTGVEVTRMRYGCDPCYVTP
jgi:hypothetical protein